MVPSAPLSGITGLFLCEGLTFWVGIFSDDE